MLIYYFIFFFFKQKTAYEIGVRLVGSEMCIRDRSMMAHEVSHGYVAYRLGDPTAKAHGRLTANPLKHLDPLGSMMFVITYMVGGFIFGWAKPVPINPGYFRDHQRGMMVVWIAGPG